MIGLYKYKITIKWTANNGVGTISYLSYERSHTLCIDGKQDIWCSSDPAFRSGKTKHNPEDLFLASISICHMLWYLLLCGDNGVIVVDYIDNAIGSIQVSQHGSGHYAEASL